MAAPKLTKAQRLQLLEWVAADYSFKLIADWFAARKWPELTPAAITYYRNRNQIVIEQLRVERRSAALTTGLALKEERVQRLKEHADALDAIKWLPGENGRLWNEKAWREVLDDIAKEMGHRRSAVELTGKDGGPIETTDARDRLADILAKRAAAAAAEPDSSDRSGSG